MAILNMVGGGGGLSATDAILRVIAPAGSTVTIAKGSVSKSDAGHENASDTSLYDYYFIIHASQFDSVTPWTVTATLGTQSISDTITIDSADEYDMELSYTLYLVSSGVVQIGSVVADNIPSSSSTTGVTPSIASSGSYLQISLASSSGAGAGIAYVNQTVDLSKYTNVRIQGYALCGFSNLSNLAFDAWTAFGSYQTDNRLIQSNILDATSTSYTSIDLTIDISTLTDEAYVGFNFGKNGTSGTGIRIVDMWLEV